jgi:hypothetical protein
LINVKKEINDLDLMVKNSEIFNGNVVNSSIDKNILSGLNMGYSIDDQGNKQMTSGYADSIEKLSKTYREATAEANALRMAQDGLSKSTIEDILVKQNWSEIEREAAISSKIFDAAQTSATASVNADTTATWANVAATKALSVAKKAASVIGGMFVTTAITAGVSLLIGGLVKFVDGLHESEKEIKEFAENAKHAIDEIDSSFDSLKTTTDNIKERYAELAQGVEQSTGKNVKLSNDDYDEFLDLSNQLAELFPTLTKNYDSNGNAILDLKGNVSSIVAELDRLIKTQRDLANEKILEQLPDVYKDYSNNIDKYNKKLEEAKQKQEGYYELHNRLKGADVTVSEDKHVVDLTFNDLTSEDKTEIQKYITSSIEDLNHYFFTDTGKGITNIKLFLDKEFKGFEPRLQSAQEEIQKYTNLIKQETSSFSNYMNTWLQGNWLYQQQDDLLPLTY